MSTMRHMNDNDLVHALISLQTPTPLLKFGGTGKPKFRKFSLSSDFTRLQWTSPNKESQIAISDIIDIKFGQRTEKFARNKRSDLHHLSFSLMHYTSPGTLRASLSGSMTQSQLTMSPNGVNMGPVDSLDLVCKDENEWTTWTDVLQSLQSRQISNALLEKARLLVSSKSGMISQARNTDEPSLLYSWGSGCWGENTHGDLENRSKPEIVKVAVGPGVTGLACGWAYTVFVMEAGGVKAGGVFASGHRIGTGLPNDCNTLVQISIPNKIEVVQLACGSYHTLARTADSTVLSWGANMRGQLGQGNLSERSKPTLIPSLFDIVDIACGSSASAFIDTSGTLFTCGQGDLGFTGHGHDRDISTPTPLSDFGVHNPVSAVAAGDCHMIAATNTGVYSWGWNACGQLGQGNYQDQWSPREIPTLTAIMQTDSSEGGPATADVAVISLSCGAAHSALILHHTQEDLYDLYTWGANGTGQCAQQKTTNGSANICTPMIVECKFPAPTANAPATGPPVLLAVACGAYHTSMLTLEHGMFNVGSNSHGQLAIDSTSIGHSFEFIQCKVPRKGITQIACGATHSCILVNERWVADQDCPSCMACMQPFTRFRRRHHCRCCGGVFCASCSSNKAAVLKKGHTTPVRVCDSCHTKLTSY